MTSAPAKPPTQWNTEAPVPFNLMAQVRDVPDNLPDGWVNQFRYFCRLYDRISDLDGDIVECGLGKGSTFAMLAYLIGRERRRPSRVLWGYDSFEGWPEPDPSDASPRKPKKGEWGPHDFGVTEEGVRRWLRESSVYNAYPHLDVRIVKGFVGQTLPQFPRDRKIALLHLDLDLYPGYRDGLNNLWDLVAPGGIVAFDEYREFHPELPGYLDEAGRPVPKWPGCDRAVNEFFATRRHELRGPAPDRSDEKAYMCNQEGFWYHAPTQKYFVVKSSS